MINNYKITLHLLLFLFIVYSFSCSRVSKSQTIYLAQTDSLFAEMSTHKESDDIYFYVMDVNMNHIKLPGATGNVIFRMNATGMFPLKIIVVSEEVFKVTLPRDYWEGFLRCELNLISEGKSYNFVFENPKKYKEEHRELNTPGQGHGH